MVAGFFLWENFFIVCYQHYMRLVDVLSSVQAIMYEFICFLLFKSTSPLFMVNHSYITNSTNNMDSGPTAACWNVNASGSFFEASFSFWDKHIEICFIHVFI